MDEELTPEEIKEKESKRKSELAKKLVAEGKIGGNQKGAGRPKKERAQEHVAEMVKEEADNIFKALKDGLGKKNTPTVRMKAALALLEIERLEEELQIKKENQAYSNLTKEKLLELFQERIKMLQQKGLDIGDIIEGQATEVVEDIKEIESASKQ